MMSKKLFLNNMEVGSPPRHLPGESTENHEKCSRNELPQSRYLNPGPPPQMRNDCASPSTPTVNGIVDLLPVNRHIMAHSVRLFLAA